MDTKNIVIRCSITVPSVNVLARLLTGGGVMSMICEQCESTDIGYDAMVDKDGGLVRMYDSCECLTCGSSNVIEERDV